MTRLNPAAEAGSVFSLVVAAGLALLAGGAILAAGVGARPAAQASDPKAVGTGGKGLAGGGAGQGAAGGGAGGFALVELFTSEGCSSCPPADKVLGELRRKAQRDNTRVYALAFHVDYWNNLGWADRFSSAEFSARQHAYAVALSSGTYTPQMVINGHDQFVGSERARAEDGIARALRAGGGEAGPTLGVKVEASAEGGKAAGGEPKGASEAKQVRIVTIDAPEARGQNIHAALVQDGLSTVVKRGENGGRTLAHEGVVRSFASDALDSAGHATLRLTLPGDFDQSKGEIIVFASDPLTMRVRSATRVALGADAKDPAKP